MDGMEGLKVFLLLCAGVAPEMFPRPFGSIELAQPQGSSNSPGKAGGRGVLAIFVISADGEHDVVEMFA